METPARLGAVLQKIKRILADEHDNALSAQSRIDACAESARDLGIKLGLLDQRLRKVEQGRRELDRRREAAAARQRELARQSAALARQAASLQEIVAADAERRRLLTEMLRLPAE